MPWPKGKPAHNRRSGPEPETYVCNKCGIEKPISAYHWKHNQRSCKQCNKPSRAQVRAASLKKYGLTPEEYSERLEQQGNKCACCGSTETHAAKRADVFVVDHNHKTGKVRGLLCHRCNRGIGLLGDTTEGLEQAILYLNKHD